MQDLIINEELKILLPPLSNEEFAGLESDILEHGCLTALIVWNGILIDGHHRYEICQKHEIPFSVQNIVFDDLDAAKLWAWKHQEHRRNLTSFHRAELALRFKDKISEKAKERQLANLKQNIVPATLPERLEQKETREELAEIAGVSPRTLTKAEFVAEHADDETKEKLRKGEKGTSINKEFNRLKAEKKQDVLEPDSVEEPITDDTYPEPPCPNKDVQYFPKTTLKNISQESPHVLLANLFAHFRKGFVEELVIMAMEKINDKLGKTAVQKILRVLNKRYGK